MMLWSCDIRGRSHPNQRGFLGHTDSRFLLCVTQLPVHPVSVGDHPSFVRTTCVVPQPRELVLYINGHLSFTLMRLGSLLM